MRKLKLYSLLAFHALTRIVIGSSYYLIAGGGTYLAAMYIVDRATLSILLMGLGVAITTLACFDIVSMFTVYKTVLTELQEREIHDARSERLRVRIEANKRWLTEEARK